MIITENSTSTLPLPALRDLNSTTRPKRRRFKRWLFRLMNRPLLPS